MLNEYLSPNMKRKVLQLLVTQEPKVKKYSKLSDFNDAYVGDTAIPELSKNYQEYDYLPNFANLQIGKLDNVVFGFTSNLVERLTPSSMIISLGVFLFSRLAYQKLKVAETPLELGTELPFSEMSAPIRTKIYLVLYPHKNHLTRNNDQIQFNVARLKNEKKDQKISFEMRYIPPTHIDQSVGIAVEYLKKDEYHPIPTKHHDMGTCFSTQVLSEGFYISEQFVSHRLWNNILYPQNAQGEYILLKNWWESPKNKNSSSPLYTVPSNSDLHLLNDKLVRSRLLEKKLPKENEKLTEEQLESPIWITESITKVFHFCNLLSIKCGLTPYYEFVDTSIDGSGLPSNPSQPFPKDVLFNSSANGFRLPTGLELDLFFDQENQKWSKIQEKKSHEEFETFCKYIQRNGTAHLTHDIMPKTDIQGVLPKKGYIFKINKKDIADDWSIGFKLDKKKLVAKIKELSNSKEFKILRSRILIDPKMYPLDQGSNYENFVTSEFNAKVFIPYSNFNQSSIICYPYQAYLNEPNHEPNRFGGRYVQSRHQSGFRIVKNKS